LRPVIQLWQKHKICNTLKGKTVYADEKNFTLELGSARDAKTAPAASEELEHPHVFSRRRGKCQQSLRLNTSLISVLYWLNASSSLVSLATPSRAQNAFGGFRERHDAEPSTAT
jgi:hypothetical protein